MRSQCRSANSAHAAIAPFGASHRTAGLPQRRGSGLARNNRCSLSAGAGSSSGWMVLSPRSLPPGQPSDVASTCHCLHRPASLQPAASVDTGFPATPLTRAVALLAIAASGRRVGANSTVTPSPSREAPSCAAMACPCFTRIRTRNERPTDPQNAPSAPHKAVSDPQNEIGTASGSACSLVITTFYRVLTHIPTFHAPSYVRACTPTRAHALARMRARGHPQFVGMWVSWADLRSISDA